MVDAAEGGGTKGTRVHAHSTGPCSGGTPMWAWVWPSSSLTHSRHLKPVAPLGRVVISPGRQSQTRSWAPSLPALTAQTCPPPHPHPGASLRASCPQASSGLQARSSGLPAAHPTLGPSSPLAHLCDHQARSPFLHTPLLLPLWGFCEVSLRAFQSLSQLGCGGQARGELGWGPGGQVYQVAQPAEGLGKGWQDLQAVGAGVVGRPWGRTEHSRWAGNDWGGILWTGQGPSQPSCL